MKSTLIADPNFICFPPVIIILNMKSKQGGHDCIYGIVYKRTTYENYRIIKWEGALKHTFKSSISLVKFQNWGPVSHSLWMSCQNEEQRQNQVFWDPPRCSFHHVILSYNAWGSVGIFALDHVINECAWKYDKPTVLWGFSHACQNPLGSHKTLTCKWSGA